MSYDWGHSYLSHLELYLQVCCGCALSYLWARGWHICMSQAGLCLQLLQPPSVLLQAEMPRGTRGLCSLAAIWLEKNQA